MTSNLSINLPVKSGGNVGNSSISSHAQDFSISKLQQKKDREAATTSVGRAISGRRERGGPTTSIGRVGQSQNGASTSIFHNARAKRSIYDDEYVDEVRDRLRYQHIRKLIKERQAAEAAAQKSEPSVHDLGMKVGGGFRTKGRLGLKRRLFNLKKQKPSTYKHISAKDRQYFEDVVAPHMKAVSRGTGVGRVVRKKMKLQIDRDRRKGIISLDDARDFKKTVDQLPH